MIRIEQRPGEIWQRYDGKVRLIIAPDEAEHIDATDGEPVFQSYSHVLIGGKVRSCQTSFMAFEGGWKRF